MSKLSILLIPGACGLPEFYQPVIDAIAAHGYEIKGLHLPTAGLKTGPREGIAPTMYEDAAFIAKEVEKLADEGKDVILLAHSYGGLPTTQSTKELSKAERKAEGKSGGIVRLAYMTAIVPTLGVNAGEFMAEVPEESRLEMKIDVCRARMAHACFNDLSKEDGEAWMNRFVHHSAIAFGDKLTCAGYKDIPISYLFCKNDLCITPSVQQKAIDVIEEVSEKKVHVTRVDASHVPNVGNKKDVIEWVLSVAKEASIVL